MSRDDRQEKKQYAHDRMERYESRISVILRRKKMSPTKLIVTGYVLLILIGTVLLMLPVSGRSGEATPLLGRCLPPPQPPV